MLIFLLRHGLTDWNATRRCQGTTDIPLNADGIAQAQTLASRCASLSIERVYHSPLIVRQRQRNVLPMPVMRILSPATTCAKYVWVFFRA